MNSVYNINTRHAFLTRLIGTKSEEDTSLEAVNHLATVVTVTAVVAWGLELAFYFIYNRFVSKILEFLKIHHQYFPFSSTHGLK